jgi:hypothetical protein
VIVEDRPPLRVVSDTVADEKMGMRTPSVARPPARRPYSSVAPCASLRR